MASPLWSRILQFRALDRDARLLVAASSIASVPIGLLSVAMPVYMERLGLGSVLAGTFFTVTGVTSVALVIPFGVIADRYGRRRMTIFGGIGLVIAMTAIALGDTYGVFLAAAALLGVAEALSFSTFSALLAEATKTDTRTAAFSLSFFFSSLAFAAGSLLAILPDVVLAGGSADVTLAYRPAFGIAAAVSVVVPLGVFRVAVGARQEPQGRRGLLPRKSAPILTKFFASNFIIGLGAGLIIPLFTLWFFLKFGLAESTTGPLLAFSSVVMAASFLVAPLLARKYGMVRSIVAVQSAATFVLFFIPIAMNLYVVGTLYVVRNLLMNMSWPVASSFLMSTVDESERASASAVTGAAFRLPFAVSTTLGGYLLTIHLDLPFFVTTALYALGTAMFWLFFHKLEREAVEQAVPVSP